MEKVVRVPGRGRPKVGLEISTEMAEKTMNVVKFSFPDAEHYNLKILIMIKAGKRGWQSRTAQKISGRSVHRSCPLNPPRKQHKIIEHLESGVV